jgi:allantoin racemase
MRKILLINPNTSADTTRMMVSIACATLPPDVEVRGVTAQHGVPMITTAQELAASSAEVLDCWERMGPNWSGVMVACFGDPGLDLMRGKTTAPVVGICEAAMLEAAQNGRRFGVITTTPDLAGPIRARAGALGLASSYTGLRVTAGDPFELVGNAAALDAALAAAATQSFALDGAQAVVVGGGPLGQAAAALETRFDLPMIAPIASAARRLLALIDAHASTF